MVVSKSDHITSNPSKKGWSMGMGTAELFCHSANIPKGSVSAHCMATVIYDQLYFSAVAADQITLPEKLMAQKTGIVIFRAIFSSK